VTQQKRETSGTSSPSFPNHSRAKYYSSGWSDGAISASPSPNHAQVICATRLSSIKPAGVCAYSGTPSFAETTLVWRTLLKPSVSCVPQKSTLLLPKSRIFQIEVPRYQGEDPPLDMDTRVDFSRVSLSNTVRSQNYRNYSLPVAIRYEYPISAVPHETPRVPQGPLAAPATYMIKLPLPAAVTASH
jgi:hypothetical protein